MQHSPLLHAPVKCWAWDALDQMLAKCSRSCLDCTQRAVNCCDQALRFIVAVLQELAVLIEACWHANPEKRPQFTEVVATLSDILKRMPPTRHPAPAPGAGGGCCSIS